jgi:uncharacterized protein YecE (DUF72 family)
MQQQWQVDTMKPIDRTPKLAKAKAIRTSVLPPLSEQGIHLGLSSRLLKSAQTPSKHNQTISRTPDPGTRTPALFSTLEFNMDIYEPPQENTLRLLLQSSYRRIVWHVEVSDINSVKTLPPEFALFLSQLAETPLNASKEQMFVLALQPTVTYSDEWLYQLTEQRDALPYPFLIESSHRSWKTEKVQARLKSAGIEQVVFDAPKLFGLIKDVNDISAKRSYLRLLGRNSRNWFEAPPKKYEYQYSATEIREIMERIQRLRESSDDVTVIVGIHPFEHACAAAKELEKQLRAAMAAHPIC